MRLHDAILIVAAVLSLPLTASAHPQLDRGVTQYEDADFLGALQAFDAAARNADLSMEELLTLFEMRALVHHALVDHQEMREDLRRLAAVRPSYQLGPLAPPMVRDAFTQIVSEGAGVDLQIEQKAEDRQRLMVARVVNAPDQLVDHVTLTCSVGAERAAISQTSQGSAASVPLPHHGRFRRCEATARTRQGGVLFRAAIGEPRFDDPPDPDPFLAPSAPPTADTGAGSKRRKWPWIVAGAVVVVASGVTAGVIVSNRNSNSQPVVGGATVSW